MAVSSNPQGAHNTGKVQDLTDKARHTASNLTDKAQDTASHLADKARDTASNLADKARDTAANIGDRAREAVSNLPGQAEDALSSVGQRMTSLADQLRENAPREGMLGTAASSVAEGLRTGGQYLQEHDFSDMGQDVTRMVRSYPLQSLLVAFGVGCLMGMTWKR